MIYKTVIIPAAGQAARFGGMAKEMLPTVYGYSLLSRAYECVQFCDQIIIVTTEDKVQQHMREVGRLPGVFFATQYYDLDIWGAIYEGLQTPSGRYYFIMPDTYVPCNVFDDDNLSADFVLGTFLTSTPGRYGCFHRGKIVDKDPSVTRPARAWGVLAWSWGVRDFWLNVCPTSYTQAINWAMEEFGYDTFEMSFYYDMADMDEYLHFLKETE